MNKTSLKGALKFILTVTLVAIPLSAFFDSSTVLLNSVPWYLGILIVILIVLIGAFFDMIGVASAAADETPFHAMGAKRIFGVKLAIKIVRNAEKVASICSDLIGDIAGVLSGAVALAVGRQVSIAFHLTGFGKESITIGLTVLATALTIGAKACGKTLAVYYPTPIILFVSRVSTSVIFVFTGNRGDKLKKSKKQKKKRKQPT